MLAQRLAGSDLFKDVDVVVPVPLHPLRRFRRGYNQAEIIAETVSGKLGAKMCPGMLRRRRYTGTQTRLDVEHKVRNVSKAFVFGKDEKVWGFPKNKTAAASPSHILIVDDVFTTGATVNACARVLRERFGREVRISVATLAAVGDV